MNASKYWTFNTGYFGQSIRGVVYFDQLLGAVRTQKLVET